jgi:hypothetical protein
MTTEKKIARRKVSPSVIPMTTSLTVSEADKCRSM